MKLIIAGGRDLEVAPEFITHTLSHFGIEPSVVKEVVSGACGRPISELNIYQWQHLQKWDWARGIDGCGERWAKSWGIMVKREPADFDKHGLSGGPIRNRVMAGYADALLLIWDGQSKGSASMKREMSKMSKPIYEVILKKHNNKE
jgi:hypothetical protein